MRTSTVRKFRKALGSDASLKLTALGCRRTDQVSGASDSRSAILEGLFVERPRNQLRGEQGSLRAEPARPALTTKPRQLYLSNMALASRIDSLLTPEA